MVDCQCRSGHGWFPVDRDLIGIGPAIIIAVRSIKSDLVCNVAENRNLGFEVLRRERIVPIGVGVGVWVVVEGKADALIATTAIASGICLNDCARGGPRGCDDCGGRCGAAGIGGGS